jgi:hypothetical protein
MMGQEIEVDIKINICIYYKAVTYNTTEVEKSHHLLPASW